MSVQFVGARSLDARRRRRLVAPTDECAPALTAADAARLESRGLSSDCIVAVSAPWIPASLWKIWACGLLLAMALIGASVAAVERQPLRPEFEPLSEHLLAGPRPVLVAYLSNVAWAGIVAWALLVGWYRSRSQSDFAGRYRVWTWFATLLAVVALGIGTDLGPVLAALAVDQQWLPGNGGPLIWLMPLLSAALPLGLLVDRDLRRSRMTLAMFRITAGVIAATLIIPLFPGVVASAHWWHLAAVVLPATSAGLLFLTLWLQSWYVAYVCPDPPVMVARGDRPGFVARVMGSLFRRRRAEPETDETAKPRRRRKKAEDDSEVVSSAPRKRKSPVKRATKPRTRTRKPAVEESQEESAENWDIEADATQSGWDDPSQEWPAEEEAAEAAPAVTQKSGSKAGHSASPRSAAPVAQETDESPEWSDDGQSYRVDGPSDDPLKGLSKKQRRELRKQRKDLAQD